MATNRNHTVRTAARNVTVNLTVQTSIDADFDAINRHISSIHTLSYDYVAATVGEADEVYLDNPRLIRWHERQLAKLGVDRFSIPSFYSKD